MMIHPTVFEEEISSWYINVTNDSNINLNHHLVYYKKKTTPIIDHEN